jgi:hypothetical protein
MGLPPVSQTWTFSLNNVYTFASVLGATETLMFEFIGVGGFLPSTMGYTVKGSSNGTTGAMDGTNRITSASQWATNANSSTSPISWIVLTDGAGIDWCFSFNSASTDIVRLAHSPGGNYAAAATPTNQPTATDECFDAASGSWVNATASANRVFQFWGSSDKKMFRFAVYRSSALVSFIKGEKFTNALVSPATLSLAVGGGTVGAIKSFYNGSTYITVVGESYAAASSGDVCRTHSNGGDGNVQATIGGEASGGNVGQLGGGSFGSYNSETPTLQGSSGELMYPTQMGSKTSNFDGKLGTTYDQWYVITNANTTPILGDTYGSLQFLAVSTGGGIIVPWDGATTPQVA